MLMADIVQAFEACEAEPLLADWRLVSARLQAATASDSILVRRGKRELTKAGPAGFGRGWWLVRAAHVERAILCSTLTMVLPD